jgi:hypothetical protein
MEKPKEIQEGLFVMKWRTFIPMMFSIIISTNAASLFHATQQHNTEQIAYNKDRSDRVAKRHLDEAKYYFEMNQIKQELKDCRNGN